MLWARFGYVSFSLIYEYIHINNIIINIIINNIIISILQARYL